MNILNPKRKGVDATATAAWYPYYAGFSGDFAEAILRGVRPHSEFCVLDPWNGSGTTTAQATSQGIGCIGIDLNPAMVIVGKARALPRSEYPSLAPIARSIIDAVKFHHFEGQDALGVWFDWRAVSSFRSIETTFRDLLVEGAESFNVDGLSNLACFFYVGLFRTARGLLADQFSSNPTWLRRPRDDSGRISLPHRTILDRFRHEIKLMLPSPPFGLNCITKAEPILRVGNSEKLPLEAESVDLVLSSPPYCTRIDYAVATAAELAVLGISDDEQTLRRAMLGTSTVPKEAPQIEPGWGDTCRMFLNKVIKHPSKASATYYYKNHAQYFASLFRSFSELARVTRPGGKCCLVIQDSFYKDIHNDLPQIASEMLQNLGFRSLSRSDFAVSRTLAGVHPSARNYRNTFSAVESVLMHSRT